MSSGCILRKNGPEWGCGAGGEEVKYMLRYRRHRPKELKQISSKKERIIQSTIGAGSEADEC